MEKDFTVVLSAESFMPGGRVCYTLRIADAAYEDMARAFRSGRWLYTLRPAYFTAADAAARAVASARSEDEAVFKAAACGHMPRFVFRPDTGVYDTSKRRLVWKPGVQDGKISSKGKGKTECRR